MYFFLAKLRIVFLNILRNKYGFNLQIKVNDNFTVHHGLLIAHYAAVFHRNPNAV